MFHAEQGRGLAVVLLHGFPLDHRMYRPQIDALSRSHRVIAPDLTGFGRTTSDQPFTMDSLAKDVHALLERVGALPCVLGGFSMGGYVALSFAKRYPGDLKGLMLIDTRAEGDSAEGKAGRMKMIDLVKSAGPKAVADQMIPKMYTPATLADRPELVAQTRQMMEACPPLTIEHALLAMRDREDHSHNLPSIAAPTLIVVGEHDAITTPAMAQTMAAGVRGATLKIIPNAAHLSPLEQPQIVNAAIASFLATLDRGSA